MNMQPEDSGILARLSGRRFLITGGDGMLGQAFKTQLARLVPTASVLCLGKLALDVRDPEAFAPFLSFAPDHVLHCAALVDADRCEDHVDEATASIVGGTNNALRFAELCSATLLFPQSFLIYGDTMSLVTEETQPHPLSIYGKLKLKAERAVAESNVTSLSIRMGGFFGGGPVDNNFVGRITPHLAKLIREGTTSIDIGDRVWQPTFTHDLAANSLLLLAARCNGVYCMAAAGHASFYELALEITRILSLSDRIAIHEVNAARVSGKERAKRPSSVIMRNARLEAERLDRQRPWQASLAEYLDQPFFRDMFL